MYLWQRLAALSWWAANENEVRIQGGHELAIIERPDRKRLTIEISSESCARMRQLQSRFGGQVLELKRGWLAKFSRAQKTKPLRIGKRLIITNEGRASTSRVRPEPASSLRRDRSRLVIPAGAAFGTGQHPTTAMSLRLLEQLTRSWKPGWSLIDVGTGTGILALAAKRLGAGHVTAIDIDPIACSTAHANARVNRIAGVRFHVANVLKRRLPAYVDVVAANLFSELLIQVTPKLRSARWLILSGILREQEHDVTRTLKRSGIAILKARRRGKWIAVLAQGAAISKSPTR